MSTYKEVDDKTIEIDQDYGKGGYPDIMIIDKTSYKAYMKLIDPTRGMSKKEKKLYKLLYEE